MLGDALELRKLLEPVVEDLGYELVLVELTGGGSKVLRLYIDAPGGVLLVDCQQVSRSVSAQLDVEDPITGNYSLEVSSPGLDRPLVKPEHFQRFIGQRVKVRVSRHHLGRRRFTGVLCDAGEIADGSAGIVVEVDGEEYEFTYDEIENARLDPELG
ncbi:MAG: ribosome maturation factor RimP [Parasphingorhabdus sp.]|jgi:ribosome maturation factor RimP